MRERKPPPPVKKKEPTSRQAGRKEAGEKPPGKHASWLFCIFLLLGLALRLALAWQPWDFQLKHGPLIDDAFYSLNIARHLALGHGLTFDGLHPTNGFQPLYVFLMAPVYLLFPHDLITPVYVAMTLLALANMAAGFLLYRITRRQWGAPAGLFAFGLFCFSPYIIENSVNGLETSLVALFFLLSLDIYLGRFRPEGGTIKTRFLLSASLAALVFTRVDGGLLAAAIALDFILRPLPGAPDLAVRFRRMAEVSAIALLLYSPWMIYQLVAFHRVLPMSGEAVRFLAQSFGGWGLALEVPPFSPGEPPLRFYLGHLIYSVFSLYRGQLFFPANPIAFFLYLMGEATGIPGLNSWPVVLVLFVGGLGCARWLTREMDALFLSILFLLAAYNFYVFGHWFFFRYFYPVQLCLLLLSAAVFKFFWERLTGRVRMIFLGGVVLAYAVAFIYTGGRRLSFSTDDNIITYYQVAKSLAKVVEPEARVGVFQAGTIGYFAERTVINLDGVVNASALRALREKKLMAYLLSERISYVTDYALITQTLLLPAVEPEGRSRLRPLVPPQSKVQLFHVLLHSPPLPTSP